MNDKKFKIENLNLIASFFEKSDEGVLVADFKTKKFIFANKKICKLLGYKKSELLKLGVFDIHQKKDEKKIISKFSQAVIGEKNIVKLLKVIKKNGEKILCDVQEMALIYKGKKVVVGFFTEVPSEEKIIFDSELLEEEALNSLPGLLIILDRKGKIKFANEEMEEFIGKKRKEFIGKFIFEIFPEKRNFYKKILSSSGHYGHSEEFEEEFIKKSGELKNYLTIVKPLRNNLGKIWGIQINSFELRERRALEKIARGKELLYSDLFEGSVIPMFAIDRNHKITHWNRAFEKVCGISAKKMIGTNQQWKAFYSHKRPVLADLVLEKKVLKTIPKWYKEGGKILVKKSLALSDVYQGENFFPKMGESGKWLYFVATTIKNKEGRVIGAIETLEDITDEKIDKQRLIENERKYRDLYENIPGTVYRCLNDSNWSMVSVSRAIKDLCGYDAEEFLDNNKVSLEKITHPEDRVKVRKEFIIATEKDQLYEIDYRIISKNGDVHWVHDRGQAVRDDQGKIKYIDGLLFDFTDRKKISEELRKEKELTQKYLELVGVMVVIIDQQGKVKLINKAGLDILEAESRDVLGKNWFDNFVPKSQRKAVKAVFKQIVAGEMKMSEFFENDILTKTGKEKNISWHNSVIQDKNNFMVISSGSDVTEARRIARELSESERKYRTLVEFAGDSILFINTKGVIVEANKAITEKLGYEKEYIIGKKINELHDLIPLESMKKIISNFGGRLTGRHSSPYTVTLMSRKKEIGFFEISGSLIREGKRKLGVMAIIRDVNEREKSKLALRESEYKYRSLVANLPNAIYTVLPDKHRSCLFMSERWQKWTGYAPEAFYNNNHLWFKTVHANDRKNLSLKLLTAFSEGKPYIAEYRLLQKNGKVLHVLDQGIPNKDKFGAVINYNGIVTDISRIKEVESELRNSEEKLRIIVDEIGDGVLVVDKKCNTLIFNKQASLISGFEKAEIMGKCYETVLKFVVESTGKEIKDFLKKSLKQGKEVAMKNHTLLVRKDGGKISIASSISVLRDLSGEIIGCVLVFRDISREREIDRMKSEFVSVASHQLKTPLSGIKWFTELLLREKVGELNEKQTDFINQIRVSNERLISLVTDLLNVSHIETNRNFEINKKSVSIHKIIERVKALHANIAQKKNIQIVHQNGAIERLKINIDEDKIRQVFSNLVVNAVKYSKPGGQITIEAEERPGDVIFSVHDDGIGIEQKDFPKVFTKFYRGENAIKSETDGTGLGLYIAKAIVEAHGGSIWFDSEINTGSTFYFLLKK